MVKNLLDKCVREQNDDISNDINEYLFIEHMVIFTRHMKEFWQHKFNEAMPELTSEEYQEFWEATKKKHIPRISENIKQIKEDRKKEGDEYSYFQ